MLKRGAAARRLGVTVKTLQRWDRDGLFAPLTRSLAGLRLYKPDLRNYRRQLDGALKQDASHVAGPSNQA